jgi:hypothetical protein
MGTRQLSPAQFLEVSTLVANYIHQQRESFSPRATLVPPALRVQMNGFFRPELLNSTRTVVLQNERLGNPDFYPMLHTLGFRNLPDFAAMAAITFMDVIVSHEPLGSSILFHELVHVEQYRQLGFERFAELYVRGFLSGGSYEAIPLEINAYGLGGTFEKAPHRAFSVEAEVSTWIREDRF